MAFWVDEETGNIKLPTNSFGKDLLKRELDCAVIETVHSNRRKINKLDSAMQLFDSVRSPFWEGERIYENAGFRLKNHIQICVVNSSCIKGYFNPIDL